MAEVLHMVEIPAAHALLRRGTHRYHGRMDRTSVLAPLARPGVTLAAYATAMVSLERAYEAIDSVLLRSSALCPKEMAAYTPRVPRIEQDLRALEVGGARLERQRVGTGLKLPATEAEYLGIRYVVEGAQLGGRLIYGQLCGSFGEGMERFGTFWMPEWYPPGNWTALLQSLTRVTSRDGLAACVRAARLTFRHMDGCLRGNECEVV